MKAGKETGGQATSTVPAQSVVARPSLFERLGADHGGGVILVAAPAGSGKTVLLRSWIADAGLAGRTAWVSVERGESDAQRFWLAVIAGLRAAAGDDAFVEAVTPTPDFDGRAIVDRLVAELRALEEPVVLVIDDLHELSSGEALAQLEVLLARRPEQLRVVLASHRDPQLGLHRLRLTGQLVEVRTADLRFTLNETRELLGASGIVLPDESLALLQARTEGWVAGLRLAALSLAGRPDPERFVAEFSGSERTVADYLLSEVLERQPDEVQRLLLQTCVLERVNGALADRLVQGSGSERILHALEDANAFVFSLDAQRSWFRYHQLFAEMLRLELRRTHPVALPELHRTAAEWYAEHGYMADAIQHAQAAQDWRYATRLLADNALSLTLDGQLATVNALLAAFPPGPASDPELAVHFANRALIGGSREEAEAYIALAERTGSTVAEERRRKFELALAGARLSLARSRVDVDATLDEVQALLAPAEAETLSDVALTDLRAFTLLQLGVVEQWSQRYEDAVGHFEQSLELARRTGRPYIQVACLSHLALAGTRRSLAHARERCTEAIALAAAHGWEDEPIVCVALATMGSVEAWQGRFDEASNWIERAQRAAHLRVDDATKALVRYAQAVQLLGQGRLEQAVAALRGLLELQTQRVAPREVIFLTSQFLTHTLLRLGDFEAARTTLADLSQTELESSEARTALADLHLAEGDPHAAIETLAPILERSGPVTAVSASAGSRTAGVQAQPQRQPAGPLGLTRRAFTDIQALLLDAIARDLLGDAPAAEVAIERALELAEPDELVFPFVLTPASDLLERHPRYRTAHPRLLADILDVLSGSSRPAAADEALAGREGFTEAEMRVLRYLPSRLSAPEIGSELYLSLNTVKTHMRHIYAKLGVHGRTDAVERARTLGLLTVSSLRR